MLRGWWQCRQRPGLLVPLLLLLWVCTAAHQVGAITMPLPAPAATSSPAFVMPADVLRDVIAALESAPAPQHAVYASEMCQDAVGAAYLQKLRDSKQAFCTHSTGAGGSSSQPRGDPAAGSSGAAHSAGVISARYGAGWRDDVLGVLSTAAPPPTTHAQQQQQQQREAVANGGGGGPADRRPPAAETPVPRTPSRVAAAVKERMASFQSTAEEEARHRQVPPWSSLVDCYFAPFSKFGDPAVVSNMSLCRSSNLLLDSCEAMFARGDGGLDPASSVPVPNNGSVRLACELADVEGLFRADPRWNSESNRFWWSKAKRVRAWGIRTGPMTGGGGPGRWFGGLGARVRGWGVRCGGVGGHKEGAKAHVRLGVG